MVAVGEAMEAERVLQLVCLILVINDNMSFALPFSLLIFKAIKSNRTALGAQGVTAPPTRTPSNGTGGLYILSELFVSTKSPPSFDSLCLCGITY